MKQFRNLVLAGCAGLFAMASCSSGSDEPVPGIGNDPVVFTSTIGTRAVDTQWGTDAIGVYMIDHGASAIGGNVVGEADNKKYTTAGDGKFTYADQANIIRFPESGDVDFIAYYPYTATISSYAYTINVGDQGDPEAIDLMYATADNGGQGYNNTATSVNLQFTHMLSSLRMKVTDQSAELDLSTMKVVISGLPTTAPFDLSAGAVGTASGVADIEALVVTVGGNSAQADAILIPKSDLTGVTGKFSVSGIDYTWDMSSVKLEDNTRHTYNITLKTDGMITVSLESNINDWKNDDGGSEPLDPEQPMGDGTSVSPYYVYQVSDKVGETAKWIEGYIVGSTAKTRAVGTPSTENILIAATADETDEDKCVPVDISSSAVKENLDIVANPELIGKKVKVQGDIVNDIFGNTVSITNVTAQEGGSDGGGTTPGTREEFFRETCGTGEYLIAATRLKINVFTDWDMQSPIRYSDSYELADVRSTNTMDANVWFPAPTSGTPNNTCQLLIEGIDTDYKDVILTYEIAAQAANTNAQSIVVKVNGSINSEQPNYTFTATNTYQTITLNLGDNVSTLEFFSEVGVNTSGFRIDDIVLTGIK